MKKRQSDEQLILVCDGGDSILNINRPLKNHGLIIKKRKAPGDQVYLRVDTIPKRKYIESKLPLSCPQCGARDEEPCLPGKHYP